MTMGNVGPLRLQRVNADNDPLSSKANLKWIRKKPSAQDAVDTIPTPRDENTQPDQPQATSHHAPSAKEIAAARAARVRLGYESEDQNTVDQVAPVLPSGPEPMVVTPVDYVPLQQCEPCCNPMSAWEEAKTGLLSSNWIDSCQALALVQQLAAHHESILLGHLEELVPLMVKHIRSLRSQLSKIAILCFGDLVQVAHNAMLPFIDLGGIAKPTDNALVQLLLKSVSKDKKFVLEASQKVLRTCAQCLDAGQMMHKAIPYAKHKNPKVRGAAAELLLEALQQMHDGLDASAATELCERGVLKGLTPLLSDNTPEARASARTAVRMLEHALGGTEGGAKEEASQESDSGDDAVTPWQQLCKTHLTPAEQLAVKKAFAA